jgi:hypothetical protein
MSAVQMQGPVRPPSPRRLLMSRRIVPRVTDTDLGTRKHLDKRNKKSAEPVRLRQKGCIMKKAMVLFSLLTLFCVLCTRQVCAQEKSNITVRGSELNSGVVIMDVLKANKAYLLQCNQGASGCTNLKNDNYLMVELPKNFGMYECRDVEVYPQSAATSDTALFDKDKKLGEYCLFEK